MKLAGTLTIGDEKNLLFINYDSKREIYSLYSTITREDRIAMAMGEQPKSPILRFGKDLANADQEKYIIGSVQKSRATGKVKAVGITNELMQVLDTIHFARNYKFDETAIIVNDSQINVGQESKSFNATDANLSFTYEMVNGVYRMMKISYGAIVIEVGETVYMPAINSKKYNEVTDREQYEITKATLENISYADLEKALDMSWYRKDGKTLKEYKAIHSIAEFEQMFSKMMEAACETDQLVVALDTETTGVKIYDLSEDNPVLDHCVEISISWEDNKAYCIFTDMEYFSNADNEYCFKRLAEVFTEDCGERRIFWDRGQRSEIFDRTRFHLVGQNFPFDRRVSIRHKYPLWFDDDTLNMGFNIDPRVVRGNVKLKNMTRRIFKHETPELEDVLGKGNEDKYRWLADEEVATIYAGADADYTRKLYFELRKLLGERMYRQYHLKDVRMLNILAVSEYHGLTTAEEGTIALAKQSEKNLGILKDAAYSYVGAYMDYKQKMTVLEGKATAGMLTEEEFLKAASEIHPDKDAKFEFEFKGADIRMVMYDILKYPVKARTDKGVPKVDKYVRKKLLKVDRKENSAARKLNKSILVYGADYQEYEKLRNGTEAQKKKAKAMELINAEDFNKHEYPMALLFEQFAILNKEFTSYYKPILEGNLEGKIFKSYSLARIETRRIMNPSQTMKKNLKELIVPYTNEYYHLDFDLSQIELRLMYSLSGSTVLIEKMRNPENDAHTENAAMVNQIPAYQVTKKQRKEAKSVSFGVPYGLGVRSLCETIFGDTSPNHMVETEIILYQWKKANAPIVALLEKARDQALEPVELSLDKRNFMDAWKRDPETKEYVLDEFGEKIPIPMGAVYGVLGFCRYFDLSEIEQTEQAKKRRASGKFTPAESTIRRAAGNYPIQEYAAEFFRTILYRFYDRCKQEGIADKVVWNMLIHDELLCSVHKSVNPILMMKIVKEACMITLPNHTSYFVGINIGDNWEETKDDSREAPVIMVNRLIQRWDKGEFRDKTWFEHPWEYIKPLRDQYISDRIHEVLLQIQPDLDNSPINLPYILDHFDNYTVRAYVSDYPKNSPVEGTFTNEERENAIYASKFENWVLEVFGEGKLIVGLDGKIYPVKKFVGETIEIVEEEEDDFADDSPFVEEYDVYDFDEEDIIHTFYTELQEEFESDLDELDFDMSKYKEAKSVAALTTFAPKYQNLKLVNNSIVISVDNDVQTEYLKANLAPGNGHMVLFKKGNSSPVLWKKVTTSLKLDELDSLVSSLRKLPKNAMCLGNRIIFNTRTRQDVLNLSKMVTKNRGFGYQIFAKDLNGTVNNLGQVNATTDFTEF